MASASAGPLTGSTVGNVDPRLRAFWHPVGHAADLDATPRRVELLGDALVLVSIDGTPAVLPDRCPHRWARLSDGCVVDGALQCPYHGWRFDRSGRCTAIPALADGVPRPPRADLAVPAVRVAMGLVWVALADPVADLLPVPEWEAPGTTAAWLPDITASIGAGQFIDNFLDFSHFPFVHSGTFGAGEDRVIDDYDVVSRPGAHGFMVRYEHLINNHEDPGVAAGERPLLQPRVMEYTYEPPFAARLRIELPLTGVDNTIVAWARPADADRTVLSTVLLRNDLGDDHDGHRARAAVDYELAVLREDLAVLERLPGRELPLDLPAQVHTRADRITVELRRALRDALTRAGPSVGSG